jgi:glycosyltransferase involved in cell wall biosynthesis
MRYGGASDNRFRAVRGELLRVTVASGYPRWKAVWWYICVMLLAGTLKLLLRRTGLHAVMRLHPKFQTAFRGYTMKIAIDASTLSTQGGPRTYLSLDCLKLCCGLIRLTTIWWFIMILCIWGASPAAREIVLPGKKPLARLWREHLLLPRACRTEGVDLLHCPKSAIPYYAPCPVVVTLHDLIPLKHPETETFAARLYWRLQIPIAARRSTCIITDSEHARQGDYGAVRGVASDRIDVIMQGIDRSMGQQRNAAEGALIRSRYGLESGYILYVGTIQPRKNLTTLVAAYAALEPQLRTGTSVGHCRQARLDD